MRSRYSAFAVGDQAHLRRSRHPDTCPTDLAPDAGTTWTGLEILTTSEGTPFHREGTVEFVAHYRDASGTGQVHEHSRFVRHEGAWVYLGPLTRARERVPSPLRIGRSGDGSGPGRGTG